MLETIMRYNSYIIIGMMSILIFIVVIYITQMIIDTKKKHRINNHQDNIYVDTLSVLEEKTNQMKIMIENIKDEICVWKEKMPQYIYTKHQIEDDIHAFYEQIHNHQKNIFNPNEGYKSTINQEETLHREQIRIMNNNISKFFVITVIYIANK